MEKILFLFSPALLTPPVVKKEVTEMVAYKLNEPMFMENRPSDLQ